jgi:hypothetical protein
MIVGYLSILTNFTLAVPELQNYVANKGVFYSMCKHVLQ